MAQAGATMGRWGVLGAGLIGGSIAADLLAAGERVIAYDPSERAGAAIRRRGAELAGGIDELARRSEIVLCAVPGQRAAAAILSLLEASPQCLVIDTAAPKARVVRRVEGSLYEEALGRRLFLAYPCVGRPLSGWRRARAGLLAGQSLAVCLEERWEIDAAALERVFALIEITRASAVFARAGEIDAALARYMQLTRLLAARQTELVLSDPLEGLAADRSFADLGAMAARDGEADAEAAIAELERLAEDARDLAALVRNRAAAALGGVLRRGQFANARLQAVRFGERDPRALELGPSAAELLAARGPFRSLRRLGDGRLRLSVGWDGQDGPR